MNVYNHIKVIITAEIEHLAEAGKLPAGLDCRRVTVEPPREAEHGDLATNAAMVLAKSCAIPPRDLAEMLVTGLAGHGDIASAQVAGPGFVNLRLEANFWRARVGEILQAGTSYGDSHLGAGTPVNVEYVSANPTGPMHVGHGRGAVIGDGLASLLQKAGYEVTREYYINDAGAQVDALAHAAYWRYLEALGDGVPDQVMADFLGHTDLQYRGEYLVPVGQSLAEEYGDKFVGATTEDWLPTVRRVTVDAMLELIRADLAALGISFDHFTSERELAGKGAIDEVVSALEDRDLVYLGRLEPPKGKLPDDWEDREQTLFRATRFGDDVDRPLRKSDGSWTYFASDIAYHQDKFRRGFADMVDVWGADHQGYVKRMQAAVRAVSEEKATLEVRLSNLVNLLDGGKPVQMSKRAGTYVELGDVIRAVGADVVRFMMLTRNNEATLDFDLVAVTEQSRDNPVFYVQYAHARICSLLRNGLAEFPHMELDDTSLANADLTPLDHEQELAMIKLLAGWPRAVEVAAEAKEPHRIAFFLTDFAASFHGFWTRGNEDASLRFIVPGDEAATRARLALARAAALVIASGLAVMGVTPVEEMR